MKPQGATAMVMEQPIQRKAVESAKKSSVRRRISALAPNVRELLDHALEHRADHVNVTEEFGVHTPDAIYEFTKRTRRMVRQLQARVRAVELERGAA